ncbi:MAG: TAXI family TRAP transporter solute-binding subunit [Deltaproteobacteria bacterium]|nr:TAXI family TRAP transporter solute-binding subunit [Deltaproteobacteria bacterium]MBW2306717.1 TAXI family TRAP transporter solute-binding subunit [Deltaproteobacteria bacterium]
MKKIMKTTALISMMFILAVFLAGNAHAGKPSSITIVTGVTKGTWYPIGSVVADIFNKAGARSSAEPGGGVGNILAVSMGKAELGITTTNLPAIAKAGKPPFKKPVSGFLGFCYVFPNFEHIIVRKNTGINSPADLKGKPFASQRLNTSSQVVFSDVLWAYGLTEGDLKITRGSQGEGVELMKDRQVVGQTAITAPPSAAFTEIHTVLGVKVLPLSEEAVKKLIKKNPGYVRKILPKGTYPTQDEDILGIGSDAILVVQEKMPEDQVYWMAKTLIEHIADLRQAHRTMKNITVEQMANVAGVKLHPGAARAFKEALGK